MAYTTINKSTDYFNTVTYSGNGSNARSITGVGFQPDFTWIKSKSHAEDHNVYDVVRGATKALSTNSTGAEGTYTTVLQSFDTDGFTVGTSGWVNDSGKTYVGWNWKSGTTGSGNTTGSGTYKSYNYAVNTTAGFSIVKYTGNGTAGHTIPHHLGAKADFVIIKGLASGRKWSVGSSALGWTKELFLDATDAQNTATAPWNDTAPSSTVVTLGTGSNGNTNNENYIMYAFSTKTGYSKFGSYTGNGNAAGTFIYTGFKPAFFLVKRTDSANNWHMFDTVRNNYNGLGNALYPDLNNAEGTANYNDYLSNGIKIRDTDGAWNGSGGTYIFMAFGQSLVGSNNIPCTAR